MSAARLREAASLLRERAEAASEFTPGRWVAHREPGLGHVVANDDGWVCVIGDQEGDGELTAYIATMSPPVAVALAGLLDELSDRWGALIPKTHTDAIAVANAILGTTS